MKINGILRTARLVSWSYRILALISGFVVIRLINEGVGIAGYGHIAFVLAIFSGLVAVDFGVLQSVSRFVARYQSPELLTELPRFWAAIVAVACTLLFAQLLIVLGVTAIADSIDHLSVFPAEHLLLLGGLSIVSNLLTITSSIYAGFQQYGLAGFAKIMRTVVYLAAIAGLWGLDKLDVPSVLWASVASSLLSNATAFLLMFIRRGPAFSFAWQGFPAQHLRILAEVAGFSLFGWLITLSSIMISSGGVVAAGAVFSAVDAGKIQIAMVLLSGVSAFMTGGMTPLTTIAARCADGSAVSAGRRADAARQLLNETIIFSAIILVFLVAHLSPFIGLLLDVQERTPEILLQVHFVVLLVMVPAIAFMPFYLFKYALVDRSENACYGRQVFIATLGLLALGLGMSYIFGNPLLLAATIGAAVAVRAVLGYRLGRGNLPGVSVVVILRPLAMALLVFGVLSFFSKMIPIPFGYGEVSAAHIQGMLYGMVAMSAYFYRKPLSVLFDVRLNGGASD